MTITQIIVAIICSVIIIFGFTAFTGAPYVPSKPSDLRKAFKDVYKLSKKDLMIDLGAGDGIVAKIATKEFGAKAIGVELNPILALIAKFRLRKNKDAKIICQNFFKYEFPKETTVVYIFGESRDLSKFLKKIQSEATRLKHSIYLLSYAFPFQDNELIADNGMHFCYEIKPEKSAKAKVKTKAKSKSKTKAKKHKK